MRLLIATLCALTVSPALSASPFDNLAGEWTGSGAAYNSAVGDVDATCSLTVTGDAQAAKMDGKCRAALVFTRDIGIDLRKSGDTYTGTYIGSSKGPADLRGTADGETLTGTLTFPRPVHDDTTARMQVRRLGPDRFSVTVTDRVNGRTKNTTEFIFTREG